LYNLGSLVFFYDPFLVVYPCVGCFNSKFD